MNLSLLKSPKSIIKICLILGSVFLLSSSNLYAQNAYYDALYLSSLPRTDDDNIKLDKEGFEIINRYLDEDPTRNADAILTDWDNEDNPFISLAVGAEGEEEALNGLRLNKGLGINGLGGLNVTTIADGLAKFLVERVKQELSLAFFDKLQKELDEYEGLRILFPKTHVLLLSLGDEIYNFSAYVNMLREVFQEDLKTIIPNLRTLLDSDVIKESLDVNKTIKAILGNVLLVAEDLQNGAHPGDVLTNLKEANQNDTILKNFYPSLQVLDLISQSLRSNSGDRYWVSTDKLKALIQDETTFRIYLGLLLQQSGAISLKNGAGNETSFKTLLNGLGPLTTAYDANKGPIKQYLKDLIANAQRVDESLKSIKQVNGQAGQKSTYEQHYEFYTTSLNLLEDGLAIGSIPILDPFVKLDGAPIKKYFNIAHIVGDLYLDVREKNYFGAILNLSNFLETSVFSNETELTTVLKSKLDASIKNSSALVQQIEAASSTEDFITAGEQVLGYIGERTAYKNWSAFNALEKHVQGLDLEKEPKKIASVIKYLKKLGEDVEKDETAVLTDLLNHHKEILPKIIKYGNLAASIAKAESSDEVKKIIEANALPAGSASIKKRSRSNVALNAYVGLAAGPEYNGDISEFDVSLGVNAPIGIAISGGRYKRLSGTTFKEKGSNTLFFSLIDIGAVTSFRFGDTQTEELPEIKLENIFAPGVYYVYGLPKWPLSFGIGGQLGPQLRELTNTVADIDSGLSFSLKFFVAVDIPLLNFYTKSR